MTPTTRGRIRSRGSGSSANRRGSDEDSNLGGRRTVERIDPQASNNDTKRFDCGSEAPDGSDGKGRTRSGVMGLKDLARRQGVQRDDTRSGVNPEDGSHVKMGVDKVGSSGMSKDTRDGDDAVPNNQCLNTQERSVLNTEPVHRRNTTSVVNMGEGEGGKCVHDSTNLVTKLRSKPVLPCTATTYADKEVSNRRKDTVNRKAVDEGRSDKEHDPSTAKTTVIDDQHKDVYVDTRVSKQVDNCSSTNLTGSFKDVRKEIDSSAGVLPDRQKTKQVNNVSKSKDVEISTHDKPPSSTMSLRYVPDRANTIGCDDNISKDIVDINVNTDNTDSEQAGTRMKLTATQLLTIFETGALRLPGHSQRAIFKQRVYMQSSGRKQEYDDAVKLYPLSTMRTVTENNKKVLRKAFQKDGCDGFVWVESMGCVVVAICASDAGIVVRPNDIERHAVWDREGEGVPAFVYSFKEGKEPVVPEEWIEKGVARLPVSKEYGVVDGAVRVTFISEEAPQLEAAISVWIFPDQMFNDIMHDDEGNVEMRKRSCLITVLTTVAHRINKSAHSGACSSYAQHIEEISRRRTSECTNAASNMLYMKPWSEAEANEHRGGLLLRNGCGVMSVDWYAEWRFPKEEEVRNYSNRAKPDVDIGALLDGNYFPIETQGFSVRRSITAKRKCDPWYDRLFVAGRLFWDNDINGNEHVCFMCVPLSKIIARDLAVTTWIEFLHQRDTADTEGVLLDTYDMPTTWVSYRDYYSMIMICVKAVFGFEKDVQVGSKGRLDSVAVKAKRAVLHGEMNQLKYELFTLVGCGFVRRLDQHMSHAETKDAGRTHNDSPLAQWEIVAAPNGGENTTRCHRDKYSHRVRVGMLGHKELRKLSIQRSILAAEGVYRISTQLLGFMSSIVAIETSPKCPMQGNGSEGMDTASFFAKYNWHRRPSKKDIDAWSGKSSMTRKRTSDSHKGNIFVNDLSSVEWGMFNLDEDVCNVVMHALPKIRVILTDVINGRYDREIWASRARTTKETMRDTTYGFCGETVDHKVICALFNSAKTIRKEMWLEKRFVQRIERVYTAVDKDRREGEGGNAFSFAIVDKTTVDILDRVNVRTMRTFLDMPKGARSPFAVVQQSLPKVDTISAEEGVYTKQAGTRVGERQKKYTKERNYRSMKRIPMWKLHLNYLSEVCKNASDDDVKQEALVKCVTRILSGIGCNIADGDADASKMEAVVTGYISKTMANPLSKKRATTDDRILEELEEAFCEYQPPVEEDSGDGYEDNNDEGNEGNGNSDQDEKDCEVGVVQTQRPEQPPTRHRRNGSSPQTKKRRSR